MQLRILHYYKYADVAELADAPDLGSGVYDVGVQVPSSAPEKDIFGCLFLFSVHISMKIQGIKRFFQENNKKGLTKF